MSNHEHDTFLRETQNPYEMVVLAAREAARINASRVAPLDRKPASVAIERVARGEVTAKPFADEADVSVGVSMREGESKTASSQRGAERGPASAA
ncbi:MAG: hypothetical protein ACKVU1_12700 [bacterium]